MFRLDREAPTSEPKADGFRPLAKFAFAKANAARLLLVTDDGGDTFGMCTLIGLVTESAELCESLLAPLQQAFVMDSVVELVAEAGVGGGV